MTRPRSLIAISALAACLTQQVAAQSEEDVLRFGLHRARVRLAGRNVLPQPHQEFACTIDPLLRVVADDETSGVVIAPSDFEWLYHPYDGGADVFLPSRERRDLLSLAHHRWLSRYPGGL